MPSSYEESLSYKTKFIKFEKLLYCVCIHVYSCLCVYNETSENGKQSKIYLYPNLVSNLTVPRSYLGTTVTLIFILFTSYS